MKTLLVYFFIVGSISFNISAQNWFPLEVGNKYQYLVSWRAAGLYYYSLFTREISKDSVINENKYYYYNTTENDADWVRYDQSENKLFAYYSGSDRLYMDFNLLPGDTLQRYDKSYNTTFNALIFAGTKTLFSQIYNYKGYEYKKGYYPSIYTITESFAENLGVFYYDQSSTGFSGGSSKSYELIMAIIYDSLNVAHTFTNNYRPQINVNPITIINSGIFNLEFAVSHLYSRFTGGAPGTPLYFIQSVKIESFYSKGDSIIPVATFNALYHSYNNWSATKSLDTILLKNGFKYNYRIKATDIGMIPETSYSPDSGYYQLMYGPSPEQVTFLSDSIYIPTLSDSGFTKIVNTSEVPVRIDSIISVGSFYGYWGNFTRPGFQYPFYLFQTMPGFMSDTLGIIIPPHDSITVSFSNVDLCPICDYEVQEYFKDTLRFRFTFLDGDVYSFNKSIPISGEGHMSDVGDEENLPKEFALEQNYPNPFNPSTTIQYAISSRKFVTLKVYDVLGNEVAILINEEKSAGRYEINFDASKLSSGVYYYQLRAGDFIQTKKMIYLK